MVNQHPEQLARERVDQKRQDGGRLVVQGSCQVKGSPHTLPELDPMNDDPIQQLERGRCPQWRFRRLTDCRNTDATIEPHPFAKFHLHARLRHSMLVRTIRRCRGSAPNSGSIR